MANDGTSSETGFCDTIYNLANSQWLVLSIYSDVGEGYKHIYNYSFMQIRIEMKLKHLINVNSVFI